MKTVRVFVSSPGDTHFERMRVERVVERLNGEFQGIAKLEAIRWENAYYQARATFQQQIPEASACDIVIAILRHRLGTELPADFPTMPNGEPYPSGTAYEILTAIEASKEKSVPDVYVFRFTEPPTVKLDEEATNRMVTEQWERLKIFFKTWFQTSDGKFKLAFHNFQSTDLFEVEIEKLLRGWLEEKVLKGRSVLWPIDVKGSPFRGLAAFGAKHAPVFFGRSRDITKAVDALKDAGERGAPFLLIVGASGSGKSSLALAGLVPRLTAPGVVTSVDFWRVAVMRPGENPGGPVAALAARLFESETDLQEDDQGRPPALPEIADSDYATQAELATLLAHADELSVKPVIRALDKIGETEAKKSGFDRPVRADLLIVVDQLDELFSSQVSDAERARFAELLAELVATGRVWVITTLRADLYERFLKEPELLALKSKGVTYDLAPPGATEIDEIIRGPASAAGLVYETDVKTGESLDDRLIHDVDRPDMLPLLQFTLNFLFEQRVTEAGETKLTLKAYDALGGLAGAIDREGERAMEGLGKEEEERLPRLLRQLAASARQAESGGQAGSLATISVPFKEAAHDAPAERLVCALVDARILLSSGGEQNASIRLAHQRVLENWKRAKDIVAANAEFYRIRDDVEGLERRWEKSGKKRDLLIPKGVPLAEAESIAKRYPGELSPPTLGFIAASGKRARLRQRLVGAAAVVFAVLAVGATVAGIRAMQAERRAKRNFDVAGALVTDIARGLRNVEGMRAEARKKIFDQVSQTLDGAVAESPNDEQLLGMQATMFEEFASTHAAEGEQAEAAQSTVKSLEIRLHISEMSKSNERSQDASLTLERIGDLKLGAGDASGALAVYEKILANKRDLVQTEPTPAHQRELAAVLFTVADLELRSNDPTAALAALKECYDIRTALAEESKTDPELKRDLMLTLNATGTAKLRSGDQKGAIEEYGKGLDIARTLVEADKSNIEYQKDLATTLTLRGDAKLESGDNAGALADYGESLVVRRALEVADRTDSALERDIAANLSSIGDARLAAGENQKALAAYEDSANIQRRLAQADATNISLQRDLSFSLSRIGDVKRDSGDTQGAIASYQDSLAIRKRIADMEPENTQWLADQAYVLQRIGDVKRNANDNQGALAAFGENVEIARKLAATDPNNAGLKHDLSAALTKLGVVKRDAGDNTGALAAQEESLAIRRALPNTDEGKWKLEIAENLEPIGDLKLAANDKDGALATYREMLGIDRSLVAGEPGNTTWQRNMSISLSRVGDAMLAAGDNKAALASYEESLKVRRHLAEIDDNTQRQEDISLILEKVGDLRRTMGDNHGALAAYEEMLIIDRKLAAGDANSTRLKSNVAISLVKLGDARLAFKDANGALAAYQESYEIRKSLAAADKTNTRLGWDTATTLEKIADTKKGTGDKAALAAYAEAIDICRDIGTLLVGWSDNASALTVYEKSLAIARRLAEADASNVDYQYDVSVSLEDLAATKLSSGDKAGALADYEESLAIRRRLGDADKANKKWQQAISSTLEKIGDLKQGENDNSAALSMYEEMLANDRKLADANPNNMDQQREVAVGLERIAKLKLNGGDKPGALSLFDESLGIRRRLVAADPTTPTRSRTFRPRSNGSATSNAIPTMRRERLPLIPKCSPSTANSPPPISAIPSASAWCRSTSRRSQT